MTESIIIELEGCAGGFIDQDDAQLIIGNNDDILHLAQNDAEFGAFTLSCPEQAGSLDRNCRLISQGRQQMHIMLAERARR